MKTRKNQASSQPLKQQSVTQDYPKFGDKVFGDEVFDRAPGVNGRYPGCLYADCTCCDSHEHTSCMMTQANKKDRGEPWPF